MSTTIDITMTRNTQILGQSRAESPRVQIDGVFAAQNQIETGLVLLDRLGDHLSGEELVHRLEGRVVDVDAGIATHRQRHPGHP